MVEAAERRESQRHRRIEMAAGNGPDRVGHGHHGKADRQGDAKACRVARDERATQHGRDQHESAERLGNVSWWLA